MNEWHPGSWHNFTALQQPTYPDPKALESAQTQLSTLPPLVAPGEVDSLRSFIAEAAEGRRFMLQGGDCAEQFEDCDGEIIASKLKVLLQMSVVITHAARLPVFHVGRIAGQYAKPRSAETEDIGGRTLPSYRGDIINGPEATEDARRPDPIRLLQAYFRAGVTLNHLRALVAGGFADLHHPEIWELPWDGERMPSYQETLQQVRATLDFLDALGVTEHRSIRTGEIFISHEALLLPYEQGLTRACENGFYNLGAHMVWVGERTRQLDGAHLEYLRGIRNPLGVKIGPTTPPETLRATLDILDPEREPGRITLITRFGASKVEGALPPLVKEILASGRRVLWSCDPMHGNMIRTKDGAKTRDFRDILRELQGTAAMLRELGAHMGAVHFEMTGEHVTECLGGSEDLRESDLSRAYKSGCDPRLNHSQSLEMAFLIAALLQQERQAMA